MNFQQLRIVRETVRQNFNLTDVGAALFTSQSGVSKHIKDLEDELGVELFVRKGKRLTGLTDPGQDLVRIVDRLLLDAQNIKELAAHYTQSNEGKLAIATTHTQARYALPNIIRAFRKEYPKVHLALFQGSPSEIRALLLEGKADIAIATESLGGEPDIAAFPFYSWHHAVVVPRGHALETSKALTLEALAAHPIITYHEGFTGRSRIDHAFASAGVAPNIAMSALDADVIKAYVELGLGVGIMAEGAFEPSRDQGLTLIKAAHLFPENVTKIGVRRGYYLRGFAYRFIELCSPALSADVVRNSLGALE
jgi:LysR family transcriptional regulator, cys regulon transcriptional activator